MQDIYFLNEKGQLEINFESLLLKTNEDFVNQVENLVELKGMSVLSVLEYSGYVEIVLHNNYYVVQCEYFYMAEKGYINKFKKRDLFRLQSMLIEAGETNV